MEGGIHLHASEEQRNPHACLYQMLSKSYKRTGQPPLVDQEEMDPYSWAQFATRIQVQDPHMLYVPYTEESIIVVTKQFASCITSDLILKTHTVRLYNSYRNSAYILFRV